MLKFTDLMKELEYPTDERGVCHGLALMAERARHYKQYDRFQTRMNLLKNLKKGELSPLIANAKKQQKEKKTLTENEIQALTIEAFFFQVWAHNNPDAIRKFLGIKSSSFSQLDTEKVERLMFDGEFKEDTGFSPLVTPSRYCLSTDKNNNFLKAFLEKIESSAIHSSLSLGLVISSPSHTIHLFHDNKRKQWQCTSHSQLLSSNSTDRLGNGLIDFFSKNGVANLSIEVFIDEHSKKTELQHELKKISNMALENILTEGHNPNRADSYDNTLLHIAAEYGLDDTVNALLKHPQINVNQSNCLGESALYLASYNAQLNVVDTLLKHSKIQIHKANKNGLRPVDQAIYRNHDSVVARFKIHIYLSKLKLEIEKNGENYYAGMFFKNRFTNGQIKAAAEALTKVIHNEAGAETLHQHKDILNQGELKDIYHTYQHGLNFQ